MTVKFKTASNKSFYNQETICKDTHLLANNTEVAQIYSIKF